ncbi:MAG: hypothetical protein WEB09_02850 [Nitriliruptor sp.]
MTDDAARWFDDTEAEPGPPRRTRVLLVAAVAPWLVVLLLVVRGGDRTGDGAIPDHASAVAGPEAPAGAAADPLAALPDPAGRPPTVTDGATTGPAGPVTADDGPEPDQPGVELGDPRLAYGVGEAVAVAVARAWLSDRGPDLRDSGLDPQRGSYLEHVVVERIALEGPSHAVATVSAVLLEREEDRYADAVVRRLAVPLSLTPASVHPGGPPWWLPDAIDLTPVPPQLEDTGTEGLTTLVLDALTDAGYRDTTVRELATNADGLVVADVTASTALGERTEGPVWLQQDPGGIRVLGHHRDDTI